ncbi:MAG: ABC transporter substrate-binding protein [Spirochaetota bacterium]
MKAHYFNLNDTISSIINRYPETLEYFTRHGFPQFGNPSLLKNLGERITFKSAMLSKHKDPEGHMQKICAVIEQYRGNESPSELEHCTISGLLPCPVSIPLKENLEKFAETSEGQDGFALEVNLQSASGGISWLEDIYRLAESEEDLPDLAISAGFELFFEPELIGRFRDAKTFSDLSGLSHFHPAYQGINFKDPEGNYTMLGGVPAVFLVDTLQLEGRKTPACWEDILSEELTGAVSIPVEDIDLFHAVCLTLYDQFGPDAVRALGRNFQQSQHPAEMVKPTGDTQQPAVTILPWFFTRMLFSTTTLKAVWPEDGAIISPIFTVTKQSKAGSLRKVTEFLESRQTGDLLRSKGMFPSVNPSVDNNLPEGGTFRWLGWETIYGQDIGALTTECNRLFEAGKQDQMEVQL